jgi:NAD(P) transhydrogenase subunit alpha
MSWVAQTGLIGLLSVVAIGVLSLAPVSFLTQMSTLVLSVVVGYYVVWNVNHALHTPLMSVTNAISGVIVVGALLQLSDDSWPIRILACVAVLVASVNIFGGFTVTNRMLTMFRKG